MAAPRVCVLIPTLRNSLQLEVVLKSLASQDHHSDFDVAVVGPTGDAGQEVTEKYGRRWIDDAGSRNRADACNVGIKAIDCDILLFTDDDVIPPSDWVGKLVRWFERPEVAAVGGPNFAPDEDPRWAKAADVAFTAKWMTAGTRYGKVPPGELVEIEHNPGCNSAYRKSVLDQVGGYEPGCIGAEDVVLDEKIRAEGHRIWFDPTAVMPHRRRLPVRPYMQQLRNYGYVRTLANARWPNLAVWSHSVIGFFPILAMLGIITLFAGGLSGGATEEPWFTFEGEWNWARIAFHGSLGLMCAYVVLCWSGAALGNSPHRNPFTVLVSPILIFLAHWSYGGGVVRGWKQIRFGGGAEAGLGVQLDDKDRSGQ
jgi:GT2 family glycosyltransferase